MRKKLSYGRQWIDKSDIQAVAKVLRSNRLTQGSHVTEFEQKIASFSGAQYTVAFSSGTAALHAACFAAGIKNGSEVITTPMTFAASANCILYCGGKPVFVDIQSTVPLIDPKKITKKITKKTKAIIPVDFSGVPCDYDVIMRIAKEHSLIVIADASHSLGAAYKGRKVGTLADMTVFSFHPVKLITTGEGGMVVTDNKRFCEYLKLFRTHGIVKEKEHLKKKNEGPWYQEMQHLGFNYRLSDIHAALGLSQSKKAQKFIVKRQNIAQYYQKAFAYSQDIDTILVPSDRTSAWHIFPILLKQKLIKYKREIFLALQKKGVVPQVHYVPVHMHPYYRSKFGYKKGSFPCAEEFYAREFSIPMYPLLSKEDIAAVVDRIFKVLKAFN